MKRFTPLCCFCVRKQRADTGGLELGLLSSKTLTFKHSLLSPRLGHPMSSLSLALILLPPLPLGFLTPSLLSVWLWRTCVCLSPHHSRKFCVWQWQVSRNETMMFVIQPPESLLSDVSLVSLALGTQTTWLGNNHSLDYNCYFDLCCHCDQNKSIKVK